MKQKQILLVNPISSAVYLGTKLKEYGFYTVALYTVPVAKLTGYVAVKSNLFDQIVYSDAQLVNVSEQLGDYSFDFILNGLDEAFYLFEAICQQLKPEIANDQTLLEYRLNKYTMQEALKLNKMPYIRQIKLARNDLAEDLISQINYPCFIKPVNGAASVGASVCNSFSEVTAAVFNCQKSFIGSAVDEFILQEVIQGSEIFVDVFSVAGKHYVSAVHTIIKQNLRGSPCYRYEEIVSDPQLWQAAVDFVSLALDVCGFKNGFTHSELFHLSDGSFRLVEINPRISGSSGMCNRLSEVSGLPSQVDLLGRYLNHQALCSASPAMINGHSVLLYLYNFSEHPSRELKLLASDFATIQYILDLSRLGEIPTPSKDLSNVDCLVILHHQNKTQLIKDQQAISELEQNGLLL